MGKQWSLMKNPPIFQPSRKKTHNVFYMNIQIKDFEGWMSQACLVKLFGKTHPHVIS